MRAVNQDGHQGDVVESSTQAMGVSSGAPWGDALYHDASAHRGQFNVEPFATDSATFVAAVVQSVAHGRGVMASVLATTLSAKGKCSGSCTCVFPEKLTLAMYVKDGGDYNAQIKEALKTFEWECHVSADKSCEVTGGENCYCKDLLPSATVAAGSHKIVTVDQGRERVKKGDAADGGIPQEATDADGAVHVFTITFAVHPGACAVA